MPVVLGAGISGLSAAYFLTKNSIKPITIYETTNRLGGWLRSQNHAAEKYMFETGPRTIRPVGIKGKLTLKILEDLGLSSKILPITAVHPAATNRMIYVDKQLCPLPSNLSGLFRKLPPFSKPLVSAIINDITTGRSSKPLNDESIYSFAERRFGTEVAKYAVSSLICGICAGDAKEISVNLLMPDLFRNEQKYGGVIKSMLMSAFDRKQISHETYSSNLAERSAKEKWRIYSVQGGIEEIPKSMAKHLQQQNVDIQLNSNCQNVSFDGQKVHLKINENDHETDCLISSLPSYKLASLIQHQHPNLAKELNQIPYVDVAVVNLQYKDNQWLKQPAFGLLVPPSENLPILGVIFDSCCFDMSGNTVLTVMMGGKWFTEKFGINPTKNELLAIAVDQVSTILAINEQPQTSLVSIHRKCIPQYIVGHSDRIARIKNYIKNTNLPLYLCGAAYDGVGVNDTIYSAMKAVSEIGNGQI